MHAMGEVIQNRCVWIVFMIHMTIIIRMRGFILATKAQVCDCLKSSVWKMCDYLFGFWANSCILKREFHIAQLLSLTLVTLLIVIELWNCFIPDGTLIWLLIELSVLVESLSICFGNVYNIIQNLYQIKPP